MMAAILLPTPNPIVAEVTIAEGSVGEEFAALRRARAARNSNQERASGAPLGSTDTCGEHEASAPDARALPGRDIHRDLGSTLELPNREDGAPDERMATAPRPTIGVSEALDRAPTDPPAMGPRACVPEESASPANGPLTEDQRRSRRLRVVRPTTISVKRMSKRELALGRLLYPEGEYSRPATRGQCRDGARPCPFISCAFHLYLDVSRETGSIKLNFPDLEPDELEESCVLDVADQGGATLERVAQMMNMTRERVRQIESDALAKLDAVRERIALRDWVELDR
jgi:hypothetical protein